MGKPHCKILATLLILASLCVVQAAGFMRVADLIGSESASLENREQQDQEVTPEVPKIRVDVVLVTTDVTVAGANVPELRLEDFNIDSADDWRADSQDCCL